MTFITPNFDEAVEMENTPIPAGKYKARIVNCTQKASGPASKNPGTPYLSWEFRIFGAEGDLARQNNRPVFYSTMLSGPGAGGLKTLLKVLGAPLGQFNPEEFYGREVEMTLTTKRNADGTTSDWPDVRAIAPITQ